MQKITCVVLCWLLASSIGYAQSDWSALTTLTPGSRLRIESLRGGHAEGILQAVDDVQLTLEKRPAAPRAEIRKVKLLAAPRTGRFAKWGFLIGGVGGASLAYATAEGSKGTWALLQGVGWGAIGALIGAIDGRQSRERVPVFDYSLSKSTVIVGRVLAPVPAGGHATR